MNERIKKSTKGSGHNLVRAVRITLLEITLPLLYAPNVFPVSS